MQIPKHMLCTPTFPCLVRVRLPSAHSIHHAKEFHPPYLCPAHDLQVLARAYGDGDDDEEGIDEDDFEAAGAFGDSMYIPAEDNGGARVNGDDGDSPVPLFDDYDDDGELESSPSYCHLSGIVLV